MTDKNPHSQTVESVKGGTTFELGYVNIAATTVKTVTVKTCIKDGCTTAANQMTTVVSTE